MAQPFDPGQLETTGDPVSVAGQLDNIQGWTRWGVSQNGVLAYTSGAIGLEQLTWFERSGKMLAAFGPAGIINTLAISPDGSTVAFDMMNESVGSDIWLHDLRRGSDSKFTSGYYWRPVWSPDGSNVAYSSRGFAQSNAYQRSRGGGQDQKVGAGWVWDWSSDGRYFRYLDEQSFRYNNRKEMSDYDRFELALSQVTGKRLTYEHLTGKDREAASEPAPNAT